MNNKEVKDFLFNSLGELGIFIWHKKQACDASGVLPIIIKKEFVNKRNL